MRSGPPVDISIRRCLLQKAQWSSISALSRITAEQIAELCREPTVCITLLASLNLDGHRRDQIVL